MSGDFCTDISVVGSMADEEQEFRDYMFTLLVQDMVLFQTVLVVPTCRYCLLLGHRYFC